MTKKLCHTCGDVIHPDAKKYCATFHGERWTVCSVCAVGIHDGLSAMQKHGVAGEYLGDCGDNRKGVKP